MTAIWMDPGTAKASAQGVGELALRIQETMTGTRTECVCEVPRSLIGWLDDELQAITVGALQAALGYLVEAVDVVKRANELIAEQSLAAMVTASPTAAAPVATGGPVWDPRYGWVSTAPLPTGMPSGPVGQPGSGLGSYLSRPDVTANDVGTGPFGDDIMAILKMGVPGGAASAAGGGDPNILAENFLRGHANSMNVVEGVVDGNHKFNPLNMEVGQQHTGDLTPSTGPVAVPPPKPPSSTPSGP